MEQLVRPRWPADSTVLAVLDEATSHPKPRGCRVSPPSPQHPVRRRARPPGAPAHLELLGGAAHDALALLRVLVVRLLCLGAAGQRSAGGALRHRQALWQQGPRSGERPGVHLVCGPRCGLVQDGGPSRNDAPRSASRTSAPAPRGAQRRPARGCCSDPARPLARSLPPDHRSAHCVSRVASSVSPVGKGRAPVVLVLTSAMVILPALATAGLKLRAEPLVQGAQAATNHGVSRQGAPFTLEHARVVRHTGTPGCRRGRPSTP